MRTKTGRSGTASRQPYITRVLDTKAQSFVSNSVSSKTPFFRFLDVHGTARTRHP